MRTLILGAAFALASMLPVYAAAPAPSAAAPAASASPAPTGADLLKIDDCSLEYNSRSGIPAKLHVDFENLNAQPVTHIRFRIDTGMSSFPVMDVGSFRPKLKIHHDLDPPEVDMHVGYVLTENGIRGGLGCTVDAYTLADGYTWISPRLQFELQHPDLQQAHP